MAKPLKPAQSTDVFRFYTNQEYRTELIKLIRGTNRGDRVLLMSMTFDVAEPEIAAIIEEAQAAASRGVRVNIAVDAHSLMVNRGHLPGPLWLHRTMAKRMLPFYKNKLRILEKIDAYPTGHADIINMPARSMHLTVAGRSHIKTAIVNDQIFLGGCNLDEPDTADIMAGWRDPGVSDRLYRTLMDIIRKKHAGRALSWVDRGFDIGYGAKIYIDAGVRGQSLIFDEALRLIDSAEKWLVITCQFFPNSITAKHLARALKRGVKVEVIYAHPRHHGLIGGLGQRFSILRERLRVPEPLFAHALDRKDPLLHAKLIASDQGVMVGSHNYVRAGVILGTAEIAVWSGDEALAREAVRTMRRGLKKTA